MQTTFLSYREQRLDRGAAEPLAGQRQSQDQRQRSSTVPQQPAGTQNYVDSSLDAYNVVDTTISKEFEVSDGNMEAFLTVNNVLNERAPLFPSDSGLPGLFYPTLGFYDDMGRFYTAGVRVKF